MRTKRRRLEMAASVVRFLIAVGVALAVFAALRVVLRGVEPTTDLWARAGVLLVLSIAVAVLRRWARRGVS